MNTQTSAKNILLGAPINPQIRALFSSESLIQDHSNTVPVPLEQPSNTNNLADLAIAELQTALEILATIKSKFDEKQIAKATEYIPDSAKLHEVTAINSLPEPLRDAFKGFNIGASDKVPIQDHNL